MIRDCTAEVNTEFKKGKTSVVDEPLITKMLSESDSEVLQEKVT